MVRAITRFGSGMLAATAVAGAASAAASVAAACGAPGAVCGSSDICRPSSASLGVGRERSTRGRVRTCRFGCATGSSFGCGSRSRCGRIRDREGRWRRERDLHRGFALRAISRVPSGPGADQHDTHQQGARDDSGSLPRDRRSLGVAQLLVERGAKIRAQRHRRIERGLRLRSGAVVRTAAKGLGQRRSAARVSPARAKLLQ